jgi:hypothetical protein
MACRIDENQPSRRLFFFAGKIPEKAGGLLCRSADKVQSFTECIDATQVVGLGFLSNSGTAT